MVGAAACSSLMSATPRRRIGLSGTPGVLASVASGAVSPVFVGRLRQLAVLAEALAAVRAGGPAAILTGGEAGVGKSRLVAEFGGRAAAPEAAACRVLTGGCPELGAAGLPFGPFTAVLRQLVRDLGLSGLSEVLSGELARLVPDPARLVP
jgi:predicted ATPase